ncbi:hypothetical protein [Prauserella sp. PE36]|uniref:hypothetical protein n=1 Tax=Prauserella sp. PE36 TaxID=1504709 RepID=UPI001314CF42|nr:hypothetical protein [Prauserella sp. PE36]
MVENSSSGLSLLPGEVSVTVTREEHHQAELARYAPAGGERRVVVELGWCTITSGKHRGRRAVEVRLDGHRIGELTYLMSQRYGPLMERVGASGGRPGCEALIQQGEKKIEVVLRLPKDAQGALRPPPAEPVTMPVPIVPAPQPETVFQPVAAPAPAPRRPWYLRRPLWIAAAVFALFLLVGIVNGGEDDGRQPASDVALPAPATTTTTPVTTTDEPEPTTEAPEPEPPAAPPEPTYQEPAPDPVRSEAPAPPPPPPPAPEPGPGPDCHPSYEGACVPIAQDVDCEGGSGDGPAYVRGPVIVVGDDVYRLDRDGDGMACED